MKFAFGPTHCPSLYSKTPTTPRRPRKEPAAPSPPLPEVAPAPDPVLAPAPTAYSYEGFRSILNDRRIQLGLSLEELDQIAGYPSGYSAKLLTANYKKHDQQRNLGPGSFDKMLSALVIVVQIAPLEQGGDCCDLSGRETGTYPQFATVKYLKERAREGGLAAYAKMGNVKRAAWHRKGGLASAATRRAARKTMKRKKAGLASAAARRLKEKAPG